MHWIFSRSTESSQYILVHRTEPILTTLNPDWRPFRLTIGTLCNGDYDRYTGTEPILSTLNPDWRPFRLKIGTLCNGAYDRYTGTEPVLSKFQAS
jgi:hypothetical protein